MTDVRTKGCSRDGQKSALRLKMARKGTVTIEASVIVPLVFLILALLIALLIFEQNKIYYSCAACEAAVSGNFWYPEEDGGKEAAQQSADRRTNEQTFPGQKPKTEVHHTVAGSRVSFSHSSSRVLGFLWPDDKVEAKADRIRPAGVLRMAHALQKSTD